MGWRDILAPHVAASVRRMHSEAVVLCVQDTTELDFNGQAIEGLGPLVGPPKDAVQPGRRIATVSPEAGLGTALALMSPRRT